VESEKILEKASSEYADIFGIEKLDAIKAESTLDFLTV
jgi:hypothetical protein